jgi:2'-5' RNA ligase
MRLFVAVTPPPAVVDLLRSVPRPQVDRVRWTTPEQWHVTLRFLGEVPEPGPVAESLAAVPGHVDAGGVAVHIGPALAWFAGRRILQVPVAGLDGLAAAVRTMTARWGAPLDDAPFVGHITLARVRGRGRGPAHLAAGSIDASWRADAVELMSSTLAPDGSRYTTEARVPLR